MSASPPPLNQYIKGVIFIVVLDGYKALVAFVLLEGIVMCVIWAPPGEGRSQILGHWWWHGERDISLNWTLVFLSQSSDVGNSYILNSCSLLSAVGVRSFPFCHSRLFLYSLRSGSSDVAQLREEMISFII